MNNDKTYNGSCFCGDVQLAVTSKPVLMAYCHCESCRKWSAGPINAFTLWNPDTVEITKGADRINSYNKTSGSTRKFCKSCGGHLYIEHPDMGLIDVPAAVIPDLKFEPALHVNYQETVMPIKDGLPKMKDLPEEAGGSGELLPE